MSKTADDMRASLKTLGVVGTLENEIAWMERIDPALTYTVDEEALGALFREALTLINQMGVALQTAYRIVPAFKSPQDPAQKQMAELVRDAIRAHMPGFLDPHNPPTAH